MYVCMLSERMYMHIYMYVATTKPYDNVLSSFFQCCTDIWILLMLAVSWEVLSETEIWIKSFFFFSF